MACLHHWWGDSVCIRGCTGQSEEWDDGFQRSVFGIGVVVIALGLIGLALSRGDRSDRSDRNDPNS
jgi:hypothetical protein